ncbi:MAG: organoarsenical effux MFS transporter ArsJ [Gammaproteobacteria bacterium]|nr:organoarsenical effux MFS transporter ArsJ [Gammaproteobacteria bacterium]
MSDLRRYMLVTLAYWGFTLTDGALRMLVLLHFYSAGFSVFQIALMFLLYEFFGVLTNLLGGWIASHYGLKLTLTSGLLLQSVALMALAQLNSDWPSLWAIIYVMLLQALSGIAKDLTKMSSKSAMKLVVPDGEDSTLFKWVALLTGSKNTLKGVGYFLGGFLLGLFGFAISLYAMATILLLIYFGVFLGLSSDMGKAKVKIKISQILSKSPQINLLSFARFFLFGARDIWFVVGLPVFLASSLQWSHTQIGGFMALWIIAYGLIQALAPKLVRHRMSNAPQAHTARFWVMLLVLVSTGLSLAMTLEAGVWVLLMGLYVFGAIFAVNSSVHSYLILAYSERDHVAINVGFYYMANAMGRLIGTLLSGISYQAYGIVGCLWLSTLFLLAAWLFSRQLENAG